VRLEGLRQLKIPMTSLGTEPATLPLAYEYWKNVENEIK
jgi:hypothetical protein